MFGVVDESLLAAARPTLAALGLFFICMAIWPKPVTTARIPMIVVSFAFMAQYAWWRTTETLPAPALTFEYALALRFFVAEMLRIVTAALPLIVLARTRAPSHAAYSKSPWSSSLPQCPPTAG